VIERIGSVACHLALLAGSTIHPVFHVSQFKKLVGSGKVISKQLPDSSVAYRVPEAILDTRMVKRGEIKVAQVLVQDEQGACHLGGFAPTIPGCSSLGSSRK
jgi:hypothetical protein